MKYFPYAQCTGIALLGCLFSIGAAPISYPNQLYSFTHNASSPVADAVNVKAVAVEGSRIAAVTSDGRVVTSGFPETWLADGIVDQLSNVVAVSLNYTGGAVLTADGRVIEIGRASEHPPEVTNAIAIDASGQFDDDDLDFKLAVTSDGRVVVWEIYDSGPASSVEIPGVIAAAAGWNHIVALKSDGTVLQWNLGDLPTVVDGLTNVVAVAAGGEHSVALRADGTVVAWGENFFDQLDVPEGLSNVVAVSSAEYHTLALKSDGTLVAWGRFYFGEEIMPPQNLSNVMAIATSGSQDAVITTLPGPPPITYGNQAFAFSTGSFAPVPEVFDVKTVAVEGERVMAVTRDGRVVTSGFPANWLEDGTVDRLTNIVAVGLNYTGGAALTEDGRVIEVGRPSFQKPDLNNVIAIDVSGQFNDDDLDFKIAVTSDQRVVAWGLYEDSSPPSATVSGVIRAAAGWSHIVALIQDGTVVEWDRNTAPSPVAGVSNVVAVAAGGEHSVALKNDGTVVAWGQNFFGQTDVPAGLSNVVAISAAEYHTLALKSDGTLAAWGRFYSGEAVVPPQNLSNVVAIATSASRDVVISVLQQPPTLGISTEALSDGKITVTLTGAPNRMYLVESSTDLQTWQFLRLVGSGAGVVSFQVQNGEPAMRFFKAR